MKYAKAVGALLATVLSGVLAALTGDHHLSPEEMVNVAILLVGAINVVIIPNTHNSPVAKALVAASTAVLTLLTTYIVGGVDITEVLQMTLAALAAVGVYAVPNKEPQSA